MGVLRLWARHILPLTRKATIGDYVDQLLIRRIAYCIMLCCALHHVVVQLGGLMVIVSCFRACSWQEQVWSPAAAALGCARSSSSADGWRRPTTAAVLLSCRCSAST